VRRAIVLAVPIRKLSWSIFSHFVAIHFLKIAKTLKLPILGVLRSFEVILLSRVFK